MVWGGLRWFAVVWGGLRYFDGAHLTGEIENLLASSSSLVL